MNLERIDIRKLASAAGYPNIDTAVDVRVLDADATLARKVWESHGAVSAYADDGSYQIITLTELLASVGISVVPREGWRESGAGRWSARLERRKENRQCIARLIANRELARFNERWPA